MATKKLNGGSYTCTKKGDKVICESGTNTVTGNIGNDKIYGGKGADTVVIKYDSDKGFGKDTLYNLTSADTLKFSSSWDSIDEVVKSGNNLVFNSYAWNYKGRTNKVLDRIVIADYFKADKGKSINEKDRLTKFMNGSSTFTPIIDVTMKGTQNLGKGKFNLNLKGNSTVVLDKTSTANIVLGETEKWSGRTVTVKSQGMKNDYVEKRGNDLIVNYENVTEKINTRNGKVKTSIKTNSMTIKDYFSTDTSKTGRGASTINISDFNIYHGNEKISTIKELISDSGYIKVTASDLKEGDLFRFDSINRSVIDRNYFVKGSKNNDRITINNSKNNMIDSGKGNDVIHTDVNGVTNRTTFCYSGGADNYIGGYGNDTYYVGATAKSYTDVKKTSFTKSSCLLVNDKSGSDNMKISAKTSDLRIFFDVNKSAQIVVSEKMDFLRSDGEIWDSLLIFNKSALSGKNIQKMIKDDKFTGAVEIDNYFANGTTSSSSVQKTARGNGCIETISSNNTTNLNMQTWINKVASDVATWLTNNKYNTAGEVFTKENNSADINALVKVYTSVTYDKAIG